MKRYTIFVEQPGHASVRVAFDGNPVSAPRGFCVELLRGLVKAASRHGQQVEMHDGEGFFPDGTHYYAKAWR